MRLHTLRIEAFGPFAGPEVIDVDAVGACVGGDVVGASGSFRVQLPQGSQSL